MAATLPDDYEGIPHERMGGPMEASQTGFSAGYTTCTTSSSASNLSPRNGSYPQLPSPRRAMSSFSTLSPPSSSLTTTPLRGHLWKQSPSFLRGFQRRYIVVEEGRISWHAPAKSSTLPGQPPPAEGDVKGAIDLSRNACEVVPDMENPDRFRLVPSGGRWSDATFTGADTGRCFCFDATGSEYSRAWWMAAIKRHIQLGQSKSGIVSGRASMPAMAFQSRSDCNSSWGGSSMSSVSSGAIARPRQSSEWRKAPAPLLPSQVRPNSDDPGFGYHRMDDEASAGVALAMASGCRSSMATKPPPLDADYYNTDHDEMVPTWQQELGVWPSMFGPVPGPMGLML